MGRIISIVLIVSAAVFVVPRVVLAGGSWQDSFQPKTYVNADGQKLPYRLLTPEKIEPGKCYPLVLLLHGLGERGTDNVKQLLWGAGEFAKAENRRKYPCFVVVPQCPLTGLWIRGELKDLGSPNFALSKKPSEPMALVLELIDKLVAKDLPVDKSRVYVTGLSMGGFGTWDLIERRPTFFAAAIPICPRRRGPSGETQEPADLGLPRRRRSDRARPIHQGNGRGHSQGGRFPQNDPLHRRRPRQLERNLRQSRGAGLVVCPKKEVTMLSQWGRHSCLPAKLR